METSQKSHGNYSDDDEYDLEEEVELDPRMNEILEFDDKLEFVELVNKSVYDKEHIDCVIHYLFHYDAVECIKAIIEGEIIGGKFDIKAYLSSIGTTPLHNAAEHGAFGLTQLFLNNGEDPNLLGDCVAIHLQHLNQVLPLNVALTATWNSYYVLGWDYVPHWEDFTFKLIRNLCKYEMRCHLDTVRLLAQHTEELDQQISYYLKGGRIDEICVLMLVGCLSPSAALSYGEVDDESTNPLVLPDFMMKQLDEKWCKKRGQLWTKEIRKLKAKELITQLVEIFQSIGHKLQAYLMIERSLESMSNVRVASEIMSLFNDAGLSVKRKPKTQMLNSPFNIEEVKGAIFSNKHVAGTNSNSRLLHMPTTSLKLTSTTKEVERSLFPQFICARSLTSTAISSSASPRALEILENVKSAISQDFKILFLDELESLFRGEVAADSSHVMLESVKLICLHRAINCATGLIEKGYNITLDLNVAIEDGLPPLHIAARRLSYVLTKMILQYGAQPNLPSFDAHGKLPLELALEALSCHSCVTKWTPEKSLYKLFCVFSSQSLTYPLDTVKLLASRTEQLEMICFKCVENGEVVKLAALLLVTWDQMMGPYKSTDDSSVGQFILKEIRSLSDEINMKLSSSSSSHDSDLWERKNKLESAWLVLKICEGSLESIKDFRRNPLHEVLKPQYISSRIVCWLSSSVESVENPVAIRPEDVTSFVPRLKNKDKDWLNESLKRQMEQGSFTGFTTSTSVKNGTGSKFGLRSIHTSTTMSNSFTKDLKLTGITKAVERPPFLETLISARICARLLRSAMRFK